MLQRAQITEIIVKTLLVTDTNSILNRAFYGIRPLTTRDGQPTNAIFGMINIIAKQLDALSPDYCAAAFDLKEKTFRSGLFEGYKAHRKPMPDDLAAQLAPAKECLTALGLSVLELAGYEADDIIGTVASHASADGIKVFILTGDRDSLQLIGENVTVLLATNTETIVYDTEKFKETYGILPSQFVDVKALMGDSSDNIPGVAGIGEKTALKLIAQFENLDGLYENLDDKSITASVRTKLESGRESAYMSKQLAQIECCVPLGLEPDTLLRRDYDRNTLKLLFTQLEFTSFIKRFGLETDITRTKAPEPQDMDGDFLISELIGHTFAIDIESDFLHIYTDGKHYRCSDATAAAKILSSADYKTVCYDKKQLCHTAEAMGTEYTNCIFDVMLAAYVLSPGEGSYELRRLVMSYLNEDVPVTSARPDLIYRLYEELAGRVEESGQTSLLTDIELPLAAVLADMEAAGFKVDTDGLRKYSFELARHEEMLSERIYALAGTDFNINSPKQLGEVLFERLQLPAGRKTKSGYSTDAEVLSRLAPYHAIVSDILDYRQVAKLRSTYTDGLLRVAGDDGRIHTVLKQTGTATGRISSVEPNLQNIPIRTDMGRELRRFFIAKSDAYLLIDADYSQIELRLLAHIASDRRMLDAFANGEDIHTSTASAVFGVPPEHVTTELRKRAKAVNFGIVYGIGEFSLAADLGISRAQAGQFIRTYLEKFEGVAAYLKNIVQSAYELGYVTTVFGRRRYIPELKSTNKNIRSFGERVAMNSPIQGSAADIMKIAMINTQNRLKKEGLDARLIMQVHDELIIESAKTCADAAARLLREEMEGAVSLSLPLSVDVSSGPNWLCK